MDTRQIQYPAGCMIRQYNQNDYNRICEIYNASKLDELRYEATPFKLLPLERDSKRRKALLESDLYVYEQGGIIGFTAVHDLEIRALFVCSRYRGMGVGEALLRWVVDRFPGDLCLYVACSNSPAIALYEKHGFRLTDTYLTEYNSEPVWAGKMVRQVR